MFCPLNEDIVKVLPSLDNKVISGAFNPAFIAKEEVENDSRSTITKAKVFDFLSITIILLLANLLSILILFTKMGSIKENIEKIKSLISIAAEKSNRNVNEITLMAVTKSVDIEDIKKAIDEGVENFGENRVQEALKKIPKLSEYKNVRWHMIGHLQTNKVKKCLEIFDEIHSVDSIKLLEKINEQAKILNKVVNIFLQVNVSKEPTKFGILYENFDDFVKEVNSMELSNIKIKGLMTIAPFSLDPETSRPYFKRLADLAKKYDYKELCMGMSQDFVVAIEEGATIIRIGTAIFGERKIK